MPIRNYLEDHAVFEPEAMSNALEQACKALHINGQLRDREVIAARINATALRDRVLAETKAMRSL
mgnify:CR=1 FL=1